MAYIDFGRKVRDGTEPCNSIANMEMRQAGIKISKEVTVTGTGALTANVLEFTGTVTVVDQYAELTEVTTLTNATAVYADIYDGTNTVLLTDNSPGATLSSCTVGSFFTKSGSDSVAYTVHNADECRMTETGLFTRIGYPFTITAKNGATNYIRFNLTTTDNPVSFKMMVYFEYLPVDGGTLEFL